MKKAEKRTKKAPLVSPLVLPAQALIPQVHGGALLAGGQPGHKGAGGRPRNEARELSLAGYFENLPRLIRIAAGTERRRALNGDGELVEVQPTFKESIEAMKELGNRGIGNRLELETPASPLLVTVTVGPEVARERGERWHEAAVVRLQDKEQEEDSAGT